MILLFVMTTKQSKDFRYEFRVIAILASATSAL